MVVTAIPIWKSQTSQGSTGILRAELLTSPAMQNTARAHTISGGMLDFAQQFAQNAFGFLFNAREAGFDHSG